MSPADRITLTGLRARGHHGVLAHEKDSGQEFVVDVVLELDTSAAAATDDLARTVDYGALAEQVVAAVGRDPVDLIETLAARIAAVVLAAGPVRLTTVTVHKPSAPITVPFDDVSVTVVRRAAAGPPVPAVLALGSNLGDRLAHLRAAVASLAAAEDVELLAVSPVYETDPVGGPAQADYLNAVALVATTRTARSLLALAHEVEGSRARTRTERWGPRTLDVDVVSFADVRSDDPTLTLPHPRAHERAFVLAPWHDLDPDAVLPGGGRVADLLAATGASGVRRRDDLHLEVPA